MAAAGAARRAGGRCSVLAAVAENVGFGAGHLGLHPGSDIDAYATATLNNTDQATTRKLLDNLKREPHRSRQERRLRAAREHYATPPGNASHARYRGRHEREQAAG